MFKELIDFIGGGIVKEVGDVIDNVTLSKEEKLVSIIGLMNVEMDAKQKVMVAEMAQGDNYTKRARPTVVYFGLLVIGLNHVILPWIQRFSEIYMNTIIDFPPIALPEEFWWAWTGVCSVWVIGRSVEKAGVRTALTKIING